MTSMLQREAMDPQPVVPDLVTVPVTTGTTVLIASDLHLRANQSPITAHVEEVLPTGSTSSTRRRSWCSQATSSSCWANPDCGPKTRSPHTRS